MFKHRAENRRHVYATGILLFTLSVNSCGGVGTETPLRLELIENDYVSLPAGFVPAGITVATDGHVVLWDATRPALAVVRPESSSVHLIWPQLERIGGTRVGVDGEEFYIEVVDIGRKEVVRLDARGTVLSSVTVSAPVILKSAVFSQGSWIVGGVGQDGLFAIYRLDDDGVAGGPLWVSASSEHAFSALVTESTGGLLVTQQRAPFTTTRLGIDGELRGVLAPLGSDTLAAYLRSATSSDWLSISVLDFGEGLVQSLSDARSDRRVLVLYDRFGAPLRFSSDRAPLAIVASRPSTGELLAVRSGSNSELVAYGWKWVEDGKPQKGENK